MFVTLAGFITLVWAQTVRGQEADTLAPEANLTDFKELISPIFEKSCLDCHGPKKSKGGFRIDELDPNLLTGSGIGQWVEVYDVLSSSEMPPDDEPEYHLNDSDRAKVVDWLGIEMKKASQVRSNENGHSSFRRMANYEYNHALQDLLGLDLEFADSLPPESTSEDGFKNNSELLEMSAMQFETYREIALEALQKTTVKGPRPESVFYQIPMQEAMDKAKALASKPIIMDDADYAAKRRQTHIMHKETGRGFLYQWTYYVILEERSHQGIWNLKPDQEITAVPPTSPVVAVIPPAQQMRLDLGNSVPDGGTMKVRIRVGATSYTPQDYAGLRLVWGFQTNNEGKMSAEVSKVDVPVRAPIDTPELITFEIPLNNIPRNPFRKTGEIGSSPNVTEFLEIQNIPDSGTSNGQSKIDIQIDYVEIEAGIYEAWPPKSHSSIFFTSPNSGDDEKYSKEVLTRFMTKAWRRPILEQDVHPYADLFSAYRPQFDSFEDAMLEVLATVLAAPEFLYLIQRTPNKQTEGPELVSHLELANRLSFLLWSSIPDSELLELAFADQLGRPEILNQQIERMLADSRSKRFSKNFVEQWLGLEGLSTVVVDPKKFKNYTNRLREDSVREPLEFFEIVLKENNSIMDFIHSDYLVVNESLALHYGIPDVHGQRFRKIAITPKSNRGGLLTTAAVMTMNSTGVDSNPLKRGIWLLERILHDPPPPPPPNVPEVDLADPRVLQMTQKERMADHRNQAACMSCHARIDPWGIALENYDAIGSFRMKIKDKPVDAAAVLYNRKELNGIESVKSYLLSDRQDQFAKAMVHKLSSYALGRPMSFSDRGKIESMASELKKQGYGMRDLLKIVIQSELFKTKVKGPAKDE